MTFSCDLMVLSVFTVQILVTWLPLSDLLPPLMALLTRKKLCRASEAWQACALQSLSLLTSKPLLEKVGPEHLDDVIVRGIPLLALLRNGNEFGGRVLEVLGSSALGKHHSAFSGLATFSKEEGE